MPKTEANAEARPKFEKGARRLDKTAGARPENKLSPESERTEAGHAADARLAGVVSIFERGNRTVESALQQAEGSDKIELGEIGTDMANLREEAEHALAELSAQAKEHNIELTDDLKEALRHTAKSIATDRLQSKKNGVDKSAHNDRSEVNRIKNESLARRAAEVVTAFDEAKDFDKEWEKALKDKQAKPEEKDLIELNQAKQKEFQDELGAAGLDDDTINLAGSLFTDMYDTNNAEGVNAKGEKIITGSDLIASTMVILAARGVEPKKIAAIHDFIKKHNPKTKMPTAEQIADAVKRIGVEGLKEEESKAHNALAKTKETVDSKFYARTAKQNETMLARLAEDRKTPQQKFDERVAKIDAEARSKRDKERTAAEEKDEQARNKATLKDLNVQHAKEKRQTKTEQESLQNAFEEKNAKQNQEMLARLAAERQAENDRKTKHQDKAEAKRDKETAKEWKSTFENLEKIYKKAGENPKFAYADKEFLDQKGREAVAQAILKSGRKIKDYQDSASQKFLDKYMPQPEDFDAVDKDESEPPKKPATVWGTISGSFKKLFGKG